MQPRAEGCSWAAVSVRTKCRHDAILQKQRSRDGSGAQSLGVLGGQTHAGSGSCEHWPGLGVRGWKCGPGLACLLPGQTRVQNRGVGRGRLSFEVSTPRTSTSCVSGVEASHGAALSRGQFPTYQSLVGTNAGRPSARPCAGSGDAGVTEQRLGSGGGAA